MGTITERAACCVVIALGWGTPLAVPQIQDESSVACPASPENESAQFRRAGTPVGGVMIAFDNGGADVSWADGLGESGVLGLRFQGVQRGAYLPWEDSGDHPPSVSGRVTTYIHGDTIEWFFSSDRGLQHGFVLLSSPAGQGPVRVLMAVEGGFEARVHPDGLGAEFVDGGGKTVLTYSGLGVWDAKGRELSARLLGGKDAIEIEVDDHDCEYPLYVDPWIGAVEAELWSSNPSNVDVFGISVDIFKDTVVIGANGDDTVNGVDSGSAMVFSRTANAWSPVVQLLASDGSPGDNYGSVAISQDIIVVGAQRGDSSLAVDSGVVYVLERVGTAWVEQAKLEASDAQKGDRFGVHVAVDGDTVVIGAISDELSPGVPGGTSLDGSAYVFVRSGSAWIQQAKLDAAGFATNSSFGVVAIEGDTIVVGAPTNDWKNNGSGTALVFLRSGTSWTQVDQLFGSKPKALDHFGGSVAISGDRILVGAWAKWNKGQNAGAAHVFRLGGSGWVEEAMLSLGNPAPLDQFGWAVDLEGDTAVIGAITDGYPGAMQVGSAAVFRRFGTAWTKQTLLKSSTPDPLDFFGTAVAISGDTVVVGATGDQPLGTSPNIDTGAAHVFRLTPDAAVSYCTAGTSASGCQALLTTSGSPSATAAAGFVVTASNVEGGSSGLVFYGANGRQALTWGNGTSFRCIVPPTRRGAVLAGTGTAGACDGTLSQDLNARWCPTCPKSAHNPGIGTVVQAQLWYLDPQNTSNQTTSLSDAIEFCVGP